jgi:hypothetical protein
MVIDMIYQEEQDKSKTLIKQSTEHNADKINI